MYIYVLVYVQCFLFVFFGVGIGFGGYLIQKIVFGIRLYVYLLEVLIFSDDKVIVWVYFFGFFFEIEVYEICYGIIVINYVGFVCGVLDLE